MDRDKVNAFLRDLAELTNNYGIAIGGCGCCDSPYLYEPIKRITHYEICGLDGNLTAVGEE
jgi:hypothetical protein